MSLELDVLIVGAGPAGLALALELGRQGIRCALIERRTEPDGHPRASLLGARSMELLRRHGLAEPILAAGLPTHLRYEIRFVTSLAGHLLCHYESPSPDEYRAMHAGELPASADSAWSPYFKVQIGQHRIEPVIWTKLREYPSVQFRQGWELQGFTTHDGGVSASIVDLRNGQSEAVEARYLAACDGGRSVVRRQLGIAYTGRGAIGQNKSILFHAPALMEVAGTGRANLHFVFNTDVQGVITDLDGEGLYNFSHFDPAPRHAALTPEEIIERAVGRSFDFRVMRTMEWAHHQSVATRFRDGRVFLLGDAAHLFCPSAGIGMNTAIGDGFDLGWKLGAVIHGWGGESLLRSYDQERWPIAVRNTIAAADNRDRIDSILAILTEDVNLHGTAGEAARAFLRERLTWLGRQFNTMGLHLGGRYAGSCIIQGDGTPEPSDDPRIVQQSSWPGCRAPHAWLDRGVSTLDHFGSRYVLAHRPDRSEDARALGRAFQARGVPFDALPLSSPTAMSLYDKPLVLVRPDGHVCWRGEHLPDPEDSLIAKVTGH